MVVGEQAAADLQRHLVQRLCLGVLPLGVEVACYVVVASGGVGMVVGEPSSADLQRLLDQRLCLGVFPLGVEVHRRGVVAGGGVGMVVGEQAAADLQRLLEEQLCLGVFPLGVEVHRHVVVVLGGVWVVVGEQAAVNLQRLLEQRLCLGVLPLGVEGVCLLIRGIGRLVGDSILVRHRGHPAQCLETPFLVHRLEVLGPLDPRPQAEQFLRRRDRLVPAIGLQRCLDGLVQLLGPPGVVTGQLLQSRCRGLHWFGDVDWAVVGKPGIAIPNPISSPN